MEFPRMMYPPKGHPSKPKPVANEAEMLAMEAEGWSTKRQFQPEPPKLEPIPLTVEERLTWLERSVREMSHILTAMSTPVEPPPPLEFEEIRRRGRPPKVA